jgi:ubiquinone/menaquinone biosynthesis C-methylase UbiE
VRWDEVDGLVEQDRVLQREKEIAASKFHRADRRIVAEVVKTINNRQGRILEIGCGHGDVTREYIAPHCASVVATDIVDHFRKEAACDNISFQLEDALKLSFADESFDGVISIQVIEHVEDDVGFIRESLRVLKRGGTLFYTTPNRLRLSSIMRYLVGRPLRFPHLYAHDAVLADILHLREYSLLDMQKFVANFPVSSVEIRGIWLGIPSFNLGIAEPPKCLQRYAFNWHVRMVK